MLPNRKDKDDVHISKPTPSAKNWDATPSVIEEDNRTKKVL
jgi:hypothetical protein